MVRVIIAVVTAAAVQFAWGFAFYGPLSALNHMTTPTPDESALTASLRSTLPESGTYIAPMCPGFNASEEELQRHEQRAAQGPFVQIHYLKEGFTMAEMPLAMGLGFGHTLLTVFLAALLLRMVLPSLVCYSQRLLFVFGLGVFSAVAIRVSDGIWFHHSWTYVAGEMLFALVAWAVSGAVLAALIRPTQAVAASRTHTPAIAA